MSKKLFFVLGVALSVFIQNLAYANSALLFKKAELANKNQNPDVILNHVEPINEPILNFWKNTLKAEAHLMQNQPQKALEALEDFKNAPWPSPMDTKNGYSNLFERALLTLIKAKNKLEKSTVEEATLYASLFPLEDGVISTLGPLAKPSAEQKIHTLKQLSAQMAFDKINDAISLDDIRQASLANEEKCLLFLMLGKGLRNQSEGKLKALSALEWVESSPHCLEADKARAYFFEAGIHQSLASADKMILAYENLIKLDSTHFLADDARMALYKHYTKTQSRKADDYLKEIHAIKHGDMRMSYFFDEGFKAYQEKNLNTAIKAFDRVIETESPQNETLAQGYYWKARALQKQSSKNKNEAETLYKKIVTDFPFSFYCILAAKRLGIDPQPPSFKPLNDSVPASIKNEWALIDEFIDEDFFEGAQIVLEMVFLKHPSLIQTHKEAVALKLIQTQSYRRAIDLAAEHFGTGVYGPVNHTNDAMMNAFYPEVFKPEVKKAYAVSGLPLGAIEGLSREESLFNKNATSRVGAKGLMQLMPATARMIQSKVAHHSPTTDLTHPLNNMLLGSHYLKLMKDQFNALPLAIMAYNAGPGNVNRWLKQAKVQNDLKELDAFIEEIPFEETKGYVKRVMRSMNVYGAKHNENFFNKTRISMNVLSTGEV